MTEKLVVCIMGQNCERFVDMCLDSVKGADATVYCDGGSDDQFWESKIFLMGHGSLDVIRNDYDQNDKGMNGRQRNFYLNYLKKNYKDHWALCLDADEVVEDINEIKKFIQTAHNGLYSVKMRHLIGDLAHEDSTVNTHYVPNRLFKIDCADHYPEVEHPVLIGNSKQSIEAMSIGGTTCTTIWHLAYVPNMWEIKKRYDSHLAKSNMHTPEFLKDWYYQHLFGTYPRKEFNPVELPAIILKKFGIERDELYFANRGVEMKHPLMVKQWNDYFVPESVLDLGCGRGCYLYFWEWFVKERCHGIELSQWAIDHRFCRIPMTQGNINNFSSDVRWDLVTAIDVLEHLDDEDLNKALINISKSGNKFLFSIPFLGDPNLMNDKTHRQFRTRDKWIELIESHGIKIEETPKNFMFAHQLLVGRKAE